MKICIVTPDIIGPIRNGGIGTHAAMLCRLLKEHELTLLFTSEEERGADSGWKERYREQGVQVVCADELKNRDPYAKWAPWEDWFFERSRRIYEFLKERDFDLVHFQDWHANGFFSIRARRTGIGLANTRLVVTMHSPNEWSRQGMREWPRHVLVDMKLSMAERYCCEHADEVIAPSRHMFDWAAEQGWRLPEHRQVVPYPFFSSAGKVTMSATDPGHVIFFGRLETRKGLGIFIDGLRMYLRSGPDRGITRVTFLGKAGQHKGEPSQDHIDALAREQPGLQIDSVTDLDSASALKFIAESGGIVFIPSLLDNCPFTVIECIERGLPFFAAASGGIPEMADATCLFAPTREGVAEALGKRSMDFSSVHHLYSAADCNQRWLALHEDWSQSSAEKPAPEGTPQVSICIPYYNHPVYLPQLLASIAALQYANFEVIVCNDGSTQPEAKAVFEQMREQYGERGWQFLSKENGGVGHTRNFAASHAKGEFIVFMDADNLAKPDMLDIMVRAIGLSGADCLTCYFLAFETDEPPRGLEDLSYLYRPLGGGTAFSILDNTFGDANFIVRRSAFEAVGGFTTQRDASFEDWELLFKLYHAGYDTDVIPQELFWYRHLESSFSRITHHYANHQRVMNCALGDSSPLTRELISNFAIPLYYRYLELERKLGKEGIENPTPRHVPWHKHLYRFYRHLIGDPKYKKKRRS